MEKFLESQNHIVNTWLENCVDPSISEKINDNEDLLIRVLREKISSQEWFNDLDLIRQNLLGQPMPHEYIRD
jgi:hypothetical protein